MAIFKIPVAIIGALFCMVYAEAPFPERLFFKTGLETFNNHSDYVIRRQKLWARPRDQVGGRWTEVPLKGRMRGLKAVDADSELLLVVDSTDVLFSSFDGLTQDYASVRWTRHWGAPMRLGLNMRLPPFCEVFALSFLSPIEDQYYEAVNGNKHDVGAGVTHVFLLSQQGQHITYLDPWLPKDLSYEVGTPHAGRFQACALASSGSTIFIMNRYGDMYTRTYDFDMVGADDFFFHYAWDPSRCVTNDTAVPIAREVPRLLPLPGWKQEPKIDGEITDRIAVLKIPPGTMMRELRVEGKDRFGRRGYYTKRLTDTHWTFVETGSFLSGRAIENRPEDCSERTLGPDESVAFVGKQETLSVTIPHFHPYVSPVKVGLSHRGAPFEWVDLHTHETIRLRGRERGLTNKKLLLRGAVQLSEGTMVPVTIEATNEELRVRGNGILWRLNRKKGAP